MLLAAHHQASADSKNRSKQSHKGDPIAAGIITSNPSEPVPDLAASNVRGLDTGEVRDQFKIIDTNLGDKYGADVKGTLRHNAELLTLTGEEVERIISGCHSNQRQVA